MLTGNSSMPTASQTGEEAGIPTVLPTDASGATYIPPVIKSIGKRPLSPRNVTAILKDGGIFISWLPPIPTPGLPITYYVIEVNTDKDWKLLKDIDKTSYLLENPNPATTYRFRVFAYSIAAYSYSSTVAMVTTPEEVTKVYISTPVALPDDNGKDFAPRESDEKPKSGFFLSDPQIGGIIGGLLFLLVAVLLAIIGVMCSKRRDRNRGEKYGKFVTPLLCIHSDIFFNSEIALYNIRRLTLYVTGGGFISDYWGDNVKYIGPADEMDNSHNRTNLKNNVLFLATFSYRKELGFTSLYNSYNPPIMLTNEDEAEWNYGNTSGGRSSLRPIRLDNGIFIVPHTNEIYREEVTPQSTSLHNPRFYDPDNDMFDSYNSYKAPSSGKRVHNGSHPVDSFSHWPQSRNESYVDRSNFANNSVDRDPRLQTFRSPNSSRYSGRKLPQVPTVQPKTENAPSSYDPYPILKTPGSLQNVSSDDDEGGFVPKRPPLPDGYQEPYNQAHKRPYEPQRFVDVPQPRIDDPTYENFPFYPDDVFSTSIPQYPSSERPTFPRHSSMKPTSYQTYLTGDPIQNETLPFTDEISSVLPSFSEKPHDHSTDSNVFKYPYSGPEDSYKYPYSGPEDSYKYPYSGPEDSYTPQRMERPNWTLSNDRYNDSYDRSFSPGRWTHYSPVRDKQVARVSPTKKSKQNGSDSSEPISYTRDQLQGAVERVRRAPKLRRTRSTGRPFYLEQDSFDSSSPQVVPSSGYRGPNLSESDILPKNSQFRKGPHYSDSDAIPSAHDYDRYGRPYGYKYDIEPFKGVGDSRNSVSSSGRGSMPGKPRPLSDPRGYSRDNATPDSISSGIGSRNTSQATGSSMNSRIPGHYPSVSSVQTPQEHDLSHDSSPFLDGTSSLPRRDTSADENYEFDSTLLDPDLTDPLRSYPSSRNNSQLRSALESGLNTSNFYNDLYPKPSKQSRYSDSEARFEKLRQEYHQFRRKQNERYHQSRLLAMDSEML
ncbi:hypothetical protein KUTeg_006477 [Tegillarca granosa]|uniref:Fibronectin type-III domain-containing protein n=1 Tax=Tegillarca granosa TaxID=220873 RepID=A0ABQ9FGK3_TEGGR|nr:hypothetical protein KUTeg_006477 [Tegillarca granosa]